MPRAQNKNPPANPPSSARAIVGSLTISTYKLGRQEVRVGLRSGKPGQTPLMIFNGIGARLELLAPLADELNADREVIIFDIPGAGESPAPRLPYTLWEMAQLTSRLLDKLGHDRVDVMGISWGGALAQQFTLQYPS